MLQQEFSILESNHTVILTYHFLFILQIVIFDVALVDFQCFVGASESSDVQKLADKMSVAQERTKDN